MNTRHAPPIYEPLPDRHIRVLELKAGQTGAPLEAELLPVALDEDSDPAIKYEAISYCWGDLTFPKELQVGNSSLALTESLYNALQAFRRADRSRTLWADAVCINQDDIVERSAQVALMGEVFSRAERVLVWLGPAASPDGVENLAFATLAAPVEVDASRSHQELLGIIERHLEELTTACSCCESEIGHFTPITLADGLGAIAKLLERPWFERLWVVQEVALAQEIRIHCGAHHCSWEIFLELSRVPGQYDESHPSPVPTSPRSALRQAWARCNYLNQLRARNRTQTPQPFKPTGLCNDLLMLSFFKCRDPHDRIYGVSRVLGLQGFESLRADYNIPVAEVYRRVAEVSLTAQANKAGGRAAMMLALVGTEDPTATSFPDLPSWVPNLQYLSERSKSKHTFYQWVFAERQYYADACEFQCKISPDDKRELLVWGRRFGTVDQILADSACPSKHVHRRMPSQCPLHEGTTLLKWYTRCRQALITHDPHRWLNQQQQSPENLEHELLLFFSCADSTQKASNMPTVPPELIETWLRTDHTIENAPDTHTASQHLRPYITGHALDRERHLAWVTTAIGPRPAWVPSKTQPGDILSYFDSAPHPFVLRPNEEEKKEEEEATTFSLIGDAYVHGVGEHWFFSLEQTPWRRLLTDAQNADRDLKTWMESEGRLRLREDAVSRSKGESAQRLRAEDGAWKQRRQDSLDAIRRAGAGGYDKFEWIRLR